MKYFIFLIIKQKWARTCLESINWRNIQEFHNNSEFSVGSTTLVKFLGKFLDYVRSQLPSPKWSWRSKSPTGKEQLFTIMNNDIYITVWKVTSKETIIVKLFSWRIQYFQIVSYVFTKEDKLALFSLVFTMNLQMILIPILHTHTYFYPDHYCIVITNKLKPLQSCQNFSVTQILREINFRESK